MKTLEQIKDICGRESNIGMIEEEYRIFDKYTDMLYEAWEQFDDDVTRPFWEGNDKPEYPTDSFREDYYNNFCFEDEFEHFEQITKKDEDGTEWLHDSEIIDNPETLVWALQEIKAEYAENESGIYTTLENLKLAEKYCIKYDVINKIDFTREEYEEKASGEGYATFDEFINRIVEDTIENDGSINDAVFIANDAFINL